MDKTDWGAGALEEINKASSKLVVVGAVLLVIHLLNITPKEVEPLGLKVLISDPIILRGGLAIIFLHQFHTAVYGMRLFTAYQSASESNRQIARAALRRYKKNNRTWKVRRRMAKADLYIWDTLFAPYLISVTLFLIAAFVVSIVDVWNFVSYCYEHTPAGQYVREMLTDVT